MKTQTRVDIKGNDLQLHLNDNKPVTFKGITDTKQIPEYMITNLNYLIDSFYIDSQVSIRVEKQTSPFTGWDINIQSANLALTYLTIYYRNDTKEANIFGKVNGYLLDTPGMRTYKQVIKGLRKHVLSIF